jgi:predicted MFS family arabinose efflux permease
MTQTILEVQSTSPAASTDARDEEVNTVPIVAAWGAVFSLALCVAVLIASEFMPVSLLSPIASDLGVTEGHMGQAISISGIFAVITSLLISSATRDLDRRLVVKSLTFLLIVSGTVVTVAPNYAVLMVGRALLGVAIGGFWSMSTSLIMRLVAEDSVPKGLAVLNAGNAIAATVSAPLGSLMGAYIGWRGAFFAVVPLALLALIWQWISLPSLPPRRRGGSQTVIRLLARPQVAIGMASVLMLFMGQFALFTYLRPFLETVTRVQISTLSLLLLLMGLAGIAGTYCVSSVLQNRLFSVLGSIPLVMAAIALLLIAFGTSSGVTACLLVAWGFFGTAAPVGWGTWLSRTMPDDAEAGGGLLVATIQLAITVGASLGGVVFDTTGWWATFCFAAGLLTLSSNLAAVAGRMQRSHHEEKLHATKGLHP